MAGPLCQYICIDNAIPSGYLSRMPAKTSQLQIRVTTAQKRQLRRAATAAGQDVSTYVLARILPDAGAAFAVTVGQLRGAADVSFVLASVHDLLHGLAPAEFGDVTAVADTTHLAPFEANYLAAMVEYAASAKGVTPPAWTRDVPPMETPYFATPLHRLRLHLLRAAPAPFKRRNLFVDSTVGARV